MPIDEDKLRELAATLSEDQRQLLREGLAGGKDPDPDTLTASLRDFDAQSMFDSFGTDIRSAGFAADAGAPDGGAPDGGAPDGGTHRPIAPEPPLTRW